MISFLILACSMTKAQERAASFPGAEGFGKFTTGGRGGVVYTVINLNDDGPGSLREAVRKTGPRTILFGISGNIELKSPLTIHNGDVTIAGQSAPGDGICIQNHPVTVQASNVIIRFLRFRLGDLARIESDAFGGNRDQQNIIIDHCSVSWATDECASFYGNRNFTLQWCIISESLNRSVHSKGEHGYGGIWGGVGASFHHNLLAHHTSRMPRFSGSSTTPNSPEELVDFRSNVIYNWSDNNTYGGERGRYNIVGNYYKPGPATRPKSNWMLNPSSPFGKFFVDGNVYHGNEVASSDNWNGGVKAAALDSVKESNVFETESIPDQSAKKAYDVVLQYSGASLSRDAVDQRVVKEVCDGTASFGRNKDGIIDSQQDVGGWPRLRSRSPEKDTDSDGMPDKWETKRKLDLNDPSDGAEKTADNTYTNLEVYLNGLVEEIIQ
jgi:pectate lyase